VEVAALLKDAVQFQVPWITKLVQAYAPNGPPTPASVVAAARKGFWNPHEMGHLLQVAPLLSIASARWMWQCGDAAAAQHECRLQPGGALLLLRAGVNIDSMTGRKVADSGMLPSSTAPIDGLVTFLSQQKALQRPGTGMRRLGEVCRDYAGGTPPAACESRITQLGDPQEQALYRLFPGWLDQLVSQVTGRRVTLVIEPAAAHRLQRTTVASCSVFLKDAASGEQQLFCWQQPGDADCLIAHDMLTQRAVSRGCSDRGQAWYCAAVEPYAGPPAAGTGRRHSSNSSSNHSRRQQECVTHDDGTPGTAAEASAALGALTVTEAPRRVAAGHQRDGRRQQTATAAPPGDAGPCSSSEAAAGGGTYSGSGPSSSSSSRVKPSRPCAQCGELFPKLKQCSRCKAVAYCCRDCQVAHWKAGHKEACQERAAQ
jgi:hypothetical protein